MDLKFLCSWLNKELLATTHNNYLVFWRTGNFLVPKASIARMLSDGHFFLPSYKETNWLTAHDVVCWRTGRVLVSKTEQLANGSLKTFFLLACKILKVTLMDFSCILLAKGRRGYRHTNWSVGGKETSWFLRQNDCPKAL